MLEAPLCWRCGVELTDVPRPFGRRAQCPACRAELHVCRMCRHYDMAKAKHCRELAADEVKDKTRANFCDWFQANFEAYRETNAPSGRAALDSLFDAPEEDTSRTRDPRKALDDLFG